MRWRRAGRQLAVLLPIGFAFAVASSFGTIAALESARPARLGRSRHYAFQDAAAGPVIVQGRARRDAPLTSPLGSEHVAAWIGRVGRWEKSGKSSYFHVYCTLAAIDGASIESPIWGTARRLDGWSGERGHFSMRSTPRDDGYATIHLRRDGSSARPPPTVKASCPPTYPSDATYEEAILRIGDGFEVSGCNEDDRLVPCHDAADVVTIGTTRERFDESLSSAAVGELFASLFGGIGLVLIALVAARARPMLDRSKEALR